ncbi:MAG: DUF541 domain-containing protein [Candidatus Eisenbacteria bacterium]|nr:DUF541 domain-containing protein [Candidatus Eisenbacteria bacterium]
MLQKPRSLEAAVLGALLCVGLILLGVFTMQGIVKLRALDRVVTVKGLSEREVPSDIAIWPIKFTEAGNDVSALYTDIQNKNALVVEFLEDRGFREDEITVSVPSINDRQAQGYGGSQPLEYRYYGSSIITVYSMRVDEVREAMSSIADLGKQGIVIAGQEYDARTEFLFTGLNDLKPDMIEEATRNAREVAEKFAADSESRLGKIRTASQGQFSIRDRDSNTPHIKRVRVVSTITYYLSD